MSEPVLPRPTPAQLAWQRLELGMFVHVGLNTVFGVEWSDGTLPASAFAMPALDADQWAAVAVEAGARYLVLTAKHHDGFCLWPSATTAYSVASSPWREGRGDLVGEVAAACRRAGLGLGLYLSPWDRNAPCYAEPAAYDRFYVAQLTELCTRYGSLVELWFDGAGSQGRRYDWDAVMRVVRTHQPDAMVFNLGEPTIRWVGNEDGLASDPVRYVVAQTELNAYDDARTDLGVERYVPPECDVSLRRGWFHRPDDEPKTLEHLLAIHHRSVGLGANLLLNVPPDARGLVGDDDRTRLREWRAELERRFGDPVPARLERLDAEGHRWRAHLGRTVRFDHLRLREDLTAGQRVEAHAVRVGATTIARGLSVGQQRLHASTPVEAEVLEVDLEGPAPALTSLEVFDTGGATVPEIAYRASTEPPEAAGVRSATPG